MKSLASSEMTSKLSSSKSHSAAVTLARVSLSFSPNNGDKPLSLEMKKVRKHFFALVIILFRIHPVTKRELKAVLLQLEVSITNRNRE